MRIELEARGSTNRGTIAVFENEDRSVRLEMRVTLSCFPDGAVMPSSLTVDIPELTENELPMLDGMELDPRGAADRADYARSLSSDLREDR